MANGNFGTCGLAAGGAALTGIALVLAATSARADAAAAGTGEALAASEGIQLAQAAEAIDFAIPAQDLNSAILAFADRAGVQVFYDVERLGDLTTEGVQGRYTPEEALRRLLAGTGVTYRFSDAGTVTLERAAAEVEGPAELGPITVEAVPESAIGPVEGFVANRSLTGTKTNTPIEQVPQALSVITRERMDEQNSDSLSDVFRYTPGVIGEAFGNDTRVDFLRFRGFNDEGNAVFRDGLQFRSSAFGQFKPELYGVQRADVLRGPSSALFGLGNPGGLVNLVTKRPPAALLAEAELEFGNFEHREGKFDLGGPIAGSDRVFFRLTGLGRDSETQVDFVDDDRLFIAPAFTFRPGEDTTLTILSHIQDDDTGSTNQFLPAEGTVLDNPNGSISTDTFTGNPDFDDFERTVYSIGYVLEHRFSDRVQVRQSARYNRLDVDSEQVFGGGLQADLRTLNRFAFTADAETEGIAVDTHAQTEFVTGPAAHTLLAGVDYQHYDFKDRQAFGLAPPIDIFDPVFTGAIPAVQNFINTDTEQEQIGV